MIDCCIITGILALLSFACIIVLVVVFFTSSVPNLSRHENERYYIDPKDMDQKKAFASIEDTAQKDLSVIVPAYNEEERLPIMMDEMMDYFGNRQKQQKSFTYEVIVVDDGSKDKTVETALKYSEGYGADQVKVLKLERNRGKGGAVRMGMLSSLGKLLLFADADGATQFADIDKLEAEAKKIISKEDHMAVVCGSRAHLEQDSIAKRSIFRTILMHGFHFLVSFLCVRGVKDTQCGFKMVTRESGRILFNNLHVERWAFDVDMLHIAQHFRMPIAEVAVNWHEVEGSKLSPMWSSIQMGRDLILIRLRYLLGVWRMNYKAKQQ